MNWLAKRRFNYIDAVSACLVVQQVMSGYYVSAFVFWILGTILSVFVEHKSGEQS